MTTAAAVSVEFPRAAGTRALLASWRVIAGIGLTSVIVALALIGPLVAPHAPTQTIGVPFAGPSPNAWLGTDYLGRDVLSRTLSGGRALLWMASLATAVGVSCGATLGMLAAYSRNWLDDLIMRLSDLLLACPLLVLVLLFVTILGPKPWLVSLLVAVGWVPQVARVIRGAALEIMGREYIQSAEAIGVARRTILLRDVLPNITSPLMVELGVRFTWSVGTIAALSFLGYGLQPPAADWGLMINENRVGLTIQPLGVLAPALCVVLLAVGTNLIAEGIARATGRSVETA